MPTVVVKLGSSIVADEAGELRTDVLEALCDEVAARHAAGDDVVLVTSGAIARGMRLMELYGLSCAAGRSEPQAYRQRRSNRVVVAHGGREVLSKFGLCRVASASRDEGLFLNDQRPGDCRFSSVSISLLMRPTAGHFGRRE